MKRRELLIDLFKEIEGLYPPKEESDVIIGSDIPGYLDSILAENIKWVGDNKVLAFDIVGSFFLGVDKNGNLSVLKDNGEIILITDEKKFKWFFLGDGLGLKAFPRLKNVDELDELITKYYKRINELP